MKTFDDYLNEASDTELTQEKIMELAAYMSTSFNEHVKEIAQEYLAANGNERASITNIDWNYDTIDIEGEEYYCSCCGPDYCSATMPIRYLWEPNWREEVEQKQMERNLAALEKRRLEEERAKKERKEQELKQLAILKAKYEGEEDG